MISSQLEILLNKAIRKANILKHEFLTLENVLLALLSDEKIYNVLRDSGAELENLEKDLKTFVEDSQNYSILTDEEIEELGKEQFDNEDVKKMANKSGIYYQPEISLSLQRVIQRAALQVQSSGKNSILPVHLLVAMFSAKNSHAVYFMQKNGVTKFNLVDKIAHNMDKPVQKSVFGESDDKNADPLSGEGESNEKRVLEEFTTNLNELARAGKVDPIIGREEELSRVVQVLCRRRKK